MNDNNKIIYSINIEDVQNVAKQELHRLLTDKELKLVEDKIGDYINWYDAVAILIGNIIKDEKL
ncbi:MAG: hypothetical protein DRP89_08275 [Candidatus Neomarinimicrobiota bacterium]|nr:MAG: hypothetical protein DRP89_08275 [Candidatus Neomarinimicrobiota bacterium]